MGVYDRLGVRPVINARGMNTMASGSLMPKPGLAAAACIAGDDPAAIAQLPDTTGLRDGIVIESCRRIRYDQALRAAGARLVEVGDEQSCTPEQMAAAIDASTAAVIHI